MCSTATFKFARHNKLINNNDIRLDTITKQVIVNLVQNGFKLQIYGTTLEKLVKRTTIKWPQFKIPITPNKYDQIVCYIDQQNEFVL